MPPELAGCAHFLRRECKCRNAAWSRVRGYTYARAREKHGRRNGKRCVIHERRIKGYAETRLRKREIKKPRCAHSCVYSKLSLSFSLSSARRLPRNSYRLTRAPCTFRWIQVHVLATATTGASKVATFVDSCRRLIIVPGLTRAAQLPQTAGCSVAAPRRVACMPARMSCEATLHRRTTYDLREPSPEEGGAILRGLDIYD